MTDIYSRAGSGREEIAANTYAIVVIPGDIEEDECTFVPRNVRENQRLTQ